MKKIAALILTAITFTSVLAAPTPAETAPYQSWLVQAGVFYRANKLCGRPASPENAGVIGDVLLAASVNPAFTGREKSDAELFDGIRSPTPALAELVEQEKNIYLQVVGIVQAKHDVENSLCTPELPAKIAAYADAAKKAGVATFAKRIVKVMVDNKCQSLYCKPL